MFDFLNKVAHTGAINNTMVPQPQIDELLQQLCNAIKAQYINGNISASELQKVVNLARNGAQLRTVLNFL